MKIDFKFVTFIVLASLFTQPDLANSSPPNTDDVNLKIRPEGFEPFADNPDHYCGQPQCRFGKFLSGGRATQAPEAASTTPPNPGSDIDR